MVFYFQVAYAFLSNKAINLETRFTHVSTKQLRATVTNINISNHLRHFLYFGNLFSVVFVPSNYALSFYFDTSQYLMLYKS